MWLERIGVGHTYLTHNIFIMTTVWKVYYDKQIFLNLNQDYGFFRLVY